MPNQTSYASAVSFILVVLAIYFGFSTLTPKYKSDINAPEAKFSVDRALIHLKVISREPHFVGSKNHAEVRNYIANELEKLGLMVEIQDQIAINKKWRAGASTKNIIARIKGENRGKAVLLLTHYDSAPHSSLGASDAGSGVVTILEGLRAYLSTFPKPKNDIIILISDAEELGLLGANAFVKHHPWAKETELVINFEARGSGGPSIMLVETNGGNKNLIQDFNRTAPKKTLANSLFYSIYKILPNDTDLTVFREEADINGYNFAFVDDHFDYHTEQDSYDRLDRNTLLQQGDYLMSLLPFFAEADLENLNSDQDLVYFNFPGINLINYPFSWVLPMTIIGFVWLTVLLFWGFKERKLEVKSILIGFIPFLLSIILAALIGYFAWPILQKIHPQYRDILHGFTYNGHFYIAAYVALSLAICFGIYKKYFLEHDVANLFVAPIFIWLVINLSIAIFLPGAGFFIFATFISLIILGFLIFSKEKKGTQLLFYTFLVIPILLVFPPMIQMFPVGLGLKMLVISSIFVVLIFGALLPIFGAYKNQKELMKLFLLTGILLLVSATFSSNYKLDRKKPNSVVYIQDLDKNASYYASYNRKTDDFTRQYLGDSPQIGNLYAEFSPSKYGTGLNLYTPAEMANLPKPEILIIQDTLIGEDRRVQIRIVPLRKVNRIEILSQNPLHFSSFKMNGENLKAENQNFIFHTEKNPHVLSYYFSEGGEFLDVSFAVPKSEKIDLVLLEASYDLYTNPALKEFQKDKTQRDSTMIPMPFVLNDAVIQKIDLNLN